MKYLIIFILSLSISYGQARLGYTFSEIKSEMGGSSGYADGILYIKTSTSRADVVYVFDDYECIITMITPLTEGALHYYIEKYNNEYVILSKNKWRMYSNNSTVTIELRYSNDKYKFIWLKD